MFLELTSQMNLNVEKVWNLTYPQLAYIPDGWDELLAKMQEFLSPNCVDLIRFRHIDFSSIMYEALANAAVRMDFLRNIALVSISSNIEDNPASLAKALVKNGVVKKVQTLASEIKFDDNLYTAIMNFDTLGEQAAGTLIGKTNLTDDMKTELLSTLQSLSNMDDELYEISYDDITVEELRKRIKTFNNLIVRLPTGSSDEKIASRNIFMDWKKFVDDATKYLVKEEMLYVVYDVDGEGNRILDEDGEPIWSIQYGLGTDGKQHPYTEVYTDPTRSTPLIDYSYCVDKNGKVIHDRFDYWSVDDFR